MDTFLDEEGISHEFLATSTPQQNGVVERKNHTLIEMARMMLDEIQDAKTLLGRSRGNNMSCHQLTLLAQAYR